MVSSRSRTTLSVETSFTMSRISASAIAWSWMMPKRRAAGDAYWTVASESTTTKASGMTATSWRSVDCTGTRGPNRDVFFAAPNRLGIIGVDAVLHILEASSAAKQERHDEHDHGHDHQCRNHRRRCQHLLQRHAFTFR